MGLTDARPQTLPSRSGVRIAVSQTRRHVGDPRALVERDQLDAALGAFAIGADENLSAFAMLENIGRKFGRHESYPAGIGVAKSLALRHLGSPSPRLRYL